VPMKPVRVGCSGWNYKHWRETVYPKGVPQRQWLPYYATLFDTVEVNATFYRLPSRDTVEAWIENTPDDFVFSLKASRYLSHIKRLRGIANGIARLSEGIEPLLSTPKMGPLLWQLPETFHRDDERLAEALDAFPEWRHCIEFRHESWFAPDVMAMLREHQVALVIGDHPERPFQLHELTADWTYVRLHHGKRGRRGNYSASELETWRRRIAAWRSEAEVFVYCNNDWEAFAVKNASWLRDRFRPAEAG
jgi:uncharacterized protein YecE (DUF72 family)